MTPPRLQGRTSDALDLVLDEKAWKHLRKRHRHPFPNFYKTGTTVRCLKCGWSHTIKLIPPPPTSMGTEVQNRGT